MNLYVNKYDHKVRERKISLTFLFFIFLLLLLTGFELIAGLWDENYFLKIINSKTQETLLKIAVSNKEIFYLEYTNSRDLNPVIDIFQVGEDGNFFLLEERYPWYGAGQECHQAKDIYFEDNMVVVRINKEMKILPLRVAYTVEQILTVKNEKYLLSSLAKRGEAINLIIKVKGGQ